MNHGCSVIMPARNAAQYIREALASVRAQTVEPMEIIVVDDGSTDETSAIAREHGVTVIRLPSQSGPSYARNCGIAAARGETIAFLDADDSWFPCHIEASLKLLAESSAGLCFAPVEVFGSVNTLVTPPCTPREAMTMTQALLEENFIVQSSVIVRRAVLDANGVYDESLRLAEDYDLWLRLSAAVPFVMLERATVRRRFHAEQASELRRLDMIDAAWRVRKKCLESTAGRTNMSAARRLELVDRAIRREIDWAIWTGDRMQLARARRVLTDVCAALLMPMPLSLRDNVLGSVIRHCQELQCIFRIARRRLGH